MTVTTISDVDVINEIPTAPEAHKPARKRRMAREPGTTPARSLAIGRGIAAIPSSGSPPAPSKIETVIGLLSRDEGATLTKMIEATGWLPHTTRATLTKLRKKGHVIERAKCDDVTVWRIVGEV